jgi:hypothetical protein
MPDLLDGLTDSRRSEPKRIEPRYSRKTKHVTVTVYIDDVAINATVPIGELDKAIDRVCQLSDGSGPLQRLLDELLYARQKYGHIIDGTKKSRGTQSGREAIIYDLQYAAGWTYAFVRYQSKRPAKKRHPFLQRAESTLLRWLREANRLRDWDIGKPSWQITLLTAFLVGNAYADERKRHRLLDPLANYPEFHTDSFYRTYVQPRLKHVESRVQNKPKLLDSLSNAYLRTVFYPRIFEASVELR